MKLSAAIDDYAACASVELSHAKTTYYLYSARYKQFAAWLALNGHSDPELHEISYETLRTYYLQESRKGLRPRTLRSHLNALRTLFRYYHEKGAIDINPTTKLVSPKMDDANRKLVSTEELQLLLDAASRQASDFRCVRDRAILSVFIFCTLRRQELLDLAPEDVCLDERILVVQRGKGDKSRQLPLCKELHQALRDWLALRSTLKVKKGAKLFTIPGGRSMGDYALAKTIREVAAIAGFKGEARIQPHTMRHAGATRMLRNGMDLDAVRVWLGHSDIKTTSIYLHSSEQELRPMAELAGFRPRPQQEVTEPTASKPDRNDYFRSRRTAR